MSGGIVLGKVEVMQMTILAIGKPSLAWARKGVEDYSGRLSRYGRAEVEYLKEGTTAQNDDRLLKASEGFRRVVMDERGLLRNTIAMKQVMDQWERDAGVKRVAFLIGGASGHGERVRRAADEIWALSPLTLQHELALVVLLEQLYRVQTIKRGEPYHR